MFVYEHSRITIDDFQHLCPDADRASLEQDLQGMVKLGLVVEKGDSFVMT
ncbi:MAG: hypothetical protein JW751_13820 [Polyangiaceae bacterium]|nr:hypothetical protein [Polyangiaceae bacterium]